MLRSLGALSRLAPTTGPVLTTSKRAVDLSTRLFASALLESPFVEGDNRSVPAYSLGFLLNSALGTEDCHVKNGQMTQLTGIHNARTCNIALIACALQSGW